MKLELLDFTELENYPSGSGIEFYNDNIYIVGDHSSDLLVLNKKWTKPSLINLFDAADKKTLSPEKLNPELESMSVLSVDKKPHLLIIGTGSSENRNKAVFFNLKTSVARWADLAVFYSRIKTAGISELYIEGIAEVYDYLVMVNRGSSASQPSHLIITKSDFWKKPGESKPANHRY